MKNNSFDNSLTIKNIEDHPYEDFALCVYLWHEHDQISIVSWFCINIKLIFS